MSTSLSRLLSATRSRTAYSSQDVARSENNPQRRDLVCQQQPSYRCESSQKAREETRQGSDAAGKEWLVLIAQASNYAPHPDLVADNIAHELYCSLFRQPINLFSGVNLS